MNYFDYQKTENMGKVWSLFKDMHVTDPDMELNRQKSVEFFDYSHSLEIIDSALRNNIDIDGSFNLSAYESVCRKNDQMNLIKTDKNGSPTEYHIVDTKDGEGNFHTGYAEINQNDSMLGSFADEIIRFDEKDELNSAIKDLAGLQKTFIVEKGVDPVKVIINSLKGFPEAVGQLKTLVNSNTSFKETITILFSNSEKGELSTTLSKVFK